ncbi:hypothetical protein M2436_007283 [Streptomyces sp. HB372]|nr:hypothetical protein [Streptomyces sp. HB372]
MPDRGVPARGEGATGARWVTRRKPCGRRRPSTKSLRPCSSNATTSPSCSAVHLSGSWSKTSDPRRRVGPGPCRGWLTRPGSAGASPSGPCSQHSSPGPPDANDPCRSASPPRPCTASSGRARRSTCTTTRSSPSSWSDPQPTPMTVLAAVGAATSPTSPRSARPVDVWENTARRLPVRAWGHHALNVAEQQYSLMCALAAAGVAPVAQAAVWLPGACASPWVVSSCFCIPASPRARARRSAAGMLPMA